MDSKQYEKLAADFIDLWQKQLQTVITDKHFIETLFASLQQMASYATPHGYERAAPPASDDIAERISQLDFRLRMVERRLHELTAEPPAKKRAKSAAKGGGTTGKKKIPKASKRK